MDPKRWSRPIHYETRISGHYRTINNTSEAANVLLHQWPLRRGKSLSLARKACADVLRGIRPPSEARNAFIAAAVEADMFVKEK